jgi:hypothetical protein
LILSSLAAAPLPRQIQLDKLHLCKYNKGMSITTCALLRKSFAPSISTPTPSHSVPARTLVAQFRSGQCRLTSDQARRVKRWLHAWPSANENMALVMGGAGHTTLTARLRRFNGLIQVLEHSGIAARRVTSEHNWMAPAPMGALDDLSADTIWLRIAAPEQEPTLCTKEF